MKATITLITLLICSAKSFGQTSANKNDSCGNFLYFNKSREELLSYIDNPCPDDSLCNGEISTAKMDVETGHIKFLMPTGLMKFNVRQETQLKRLCDSMGIYFDYESFNCFVEMGQTKGCYGLYMDKVLALKFGTNFKDSMLERADGLYIETDPTVYYSDCDSLPKLQSNSKVENSLELKIDSDLLCKLKKCSYGDYPQVDVGFYIDTLGNASGFFVSQYNTCGESDYKYQQDLSKLAIAFVKSLGKWIPGTIRNSKVKTEFNTRVHFQ